MSRRIGRFTKRGASKRPTAVGRLLGCYQADAERKRDIVRLAGERADTLRSIADALRRLSDDDLFLSILEKEGLDTVPLPLASRLTWWGRATS
jgi:ParB family chromosome partitioning protein